MNLDGYANDCLRHNHLMVMPLNVIGVASG
jgi:hypothetical protein